MINFFHHIFFTLHFDPKLARDQALVRNSIHLFVLLLIAAGQFINWIGEVEDLIVILGFSYIFYSILLTALLFKFPALAKIACISGMILDTAILCFLMFKGGDKEVSLYGLLLFLNLANGLRFGSTYLIFTNLCTIIGFSIVLIFSTFWQQHLVMGLGLMAWLILLPAYMRILLARLENAVITAEDANTAKTQFLANMSHEIRTPLTAIIGFGKTLQSKSISAKKKQIAIETIVRNGEHLSEIINDILDISKIEAGKLTLEKRCFSLFELIHDIDLMFRQKMENKGLAFDVNFHFPLPEFVLSDSLRIKQIIINLCSNAEKFTTSGYITIDVKYDDKSQRLIITVTDSGIGMTEQQSIAVFSNFSQADSSTTRNYGGTGLGLPIAKKLANLLDGDLTVSSKVNTGSCFTFYINHPDAVTLLTKQPDIMPIKNTFFDDEINVTGNILLVEDVIDNQILISTLLEDMGATVEIAENGLLALESIKSTTYDLILMDMQMPVMGGVESIRKMRALNYTKPIIILSANVIQKEKCQEVDCQGFLSKPIDLDKLKISVGKYLQQGDPKIQNNRQKIPKDNISDQDYIISELFYKNPKLYQKIVVKFIDKLRPKILDIKITYEKEDFVGLEHLIHNFKGLSGNMGFPELSRETEAIETLLFNKEFHLCNEKINNLLRMEEKVVAGLTIIKQQDR